MGLIFFLEPDGNSNVKASLELPIVDLTPPNVHFIFSHEDQLERSV